MYQYILVLIFTLSSTLSFGQESQENKAENKTKNKEKNNFNLHGRHVVNFPMIDNDCNQEGKVVIEIAVDKSGTVISAINTNESNAPKCLIELSIKFALKTKWKPSETAPEKQVGTITYNYSF